MKCMSCQSEIDPKWSFAIQQNMCPFCGKEIMETELKNLFSTLRSTMESLSMYPEQLDDWMLSNHGYIKTNSKKLEQFLPKELHKVEVNKKEESLGEEYIVNVKTENGEVPVVAKKIQSEERTNMFFKRAEAVKPGIDGFNSTTEKTKHLKDLLQKIREGGDGDETEGAQVLQSEMSDNTDEDTVAQLQAVIDAGDPIASSLQDMNAGDDDVPSIVMAMASKAKGRATNNDAKDLASLENMVRKSRGSSSGSFSRSGS